MWEYLLEEFYSKDFKHSMQRLAEAFLGGCLIPTLYSVLLLSSVESQEHFG